MCVSPCRVNLCVCPFAEESMYILILYACMYVVFVCV